MREIPLPWTTPAFCVPLLEPRLLFGHAVSLAGRGSSGVEYSGIWWEIAATCVRCWSSWPPHVGYMPAVLLRPLTTYRFKRERVLSSFDDWLAVARLGANRIRPVPGIPDLVETSEGAPPFNGLPNLVSEEVVGIGRDDLEMLLRTRFPADVPSLVRATLASNALGTAGARPDGARGEGERLGRDRVRVLRELEDAAGRRLDSMNGLWADCQMLAADMVLSWEVSDGKPDDQRARMLSFLREHPYVLGLLEPEDFNDLLDLRLGQEVLSSPVDAGLEVLQSLSGEIRYPSHRPRAVSTPGLPLELMRLVSAARRPREDCGLGDIQARFALEVSLYFGAEPPEDLTPYVHELRKRYASSWLHTTEKNKEKFFFCRCSNLLRKRHVNKDELLRKVPIDRCATEFFTELQQDTSERDVVYDPRRIRPWLIPDLGSRAFPLAPDQLPDPAALQAHLDEWTRSPQAEKLLRLVTGDGLWEFRRADGAGGEHALDASGAGC